MIKLNNPALALLSRVALRLILMVLTIGFMLRIVMICMVGCGSLAMTFGQYVGAFAFGIVNDLFVAIIGLLFLTLFLVTVTPRKYGRPTGYILLGLLAAATVWLTWFCPALQDFNRGLAKVVRWLMLYWTLTFALRLFVPRVRHGWTRFWFAAILFVYIIVIYLNATGEYFFWNEFAVRYNFIAVDYLVYTSEVIGNIMESYPIIPMSIAIVLITGATEWLLFRKEIAGSNVLYDSYPRFGVLAIYLVCGCVSVAGLSLMDATRQSDNIYYNELQANGAYCFYDAFMNNSLDYQQFYMSLPEAEAEAILEETNGIGTADSLEVDSAYLFAGKFNRPNIVLITMESMSADYMKHFGGEKGLTPTLDSIYARGLSFDRMFANGNRTVRGLEALSLSLPPSAGQSLIKRPEIKVQNSVGKVLAGKGYRPVFLYGGDSYFDNMGAFFRNVGYDVVDKKDFAPEEITFGNVWGLCDEDSYNKLISIMDESHASGTPAFVQMMTISNHRPYTYPDGKIDISPESKSRDGGVKYSDYALGQFLKNASSRPWFDNTIFVIVADHCASSAGSTELPLEKYHIPAVIYAPSVIAPQAVEKVASQIDLMPTVLNMAGVDISSFKYGRDIFSPAYKGRAFLATYQDLGYLEDDVLTVLSPVKKVRQYHATVSGNNTFDLEKSESVDSAYVKRAVAYYQTNADAND